MTSLANNRILAIYLARFATEKDGYGKGTYTIKVCRVIIGFETVRSFIGRQIGPRIGAVTPILHSPRAIFRHDTNPWADFCPNVERPVSIP